jgi:hypothetical protein
VTSILSVHPHPINPHLPSKSTDFLSKNHHFLIKNARFDVKNAHFDVKNVKNAHFDIKIAHFPIKFRRMSAPVPANPFRRSSAYAVLGPSSSANLMPSFAKSGSGSGSGSGNMYVRGSFFLFLIWFIFSFGVLEFFFF